MVANNRGSNSIRTNHIDTTSNNSAMTQSVTNMTHSFLGKQSFLPHGHTTSNNSTMTQSVTNMTHSFLGKHQPSILN
jgi:hypothetical protein